MNDTQPKLKTFAVAVTTDIALPGKYWFSATREWTGLHLRFMEAPNRQTAEALVVCGVIEEMNTEKPGAIAKVTGVISDEVLTP